MNGDAGSATSFRAPGSSRIGAWPATLARPPSFSAGPKTASRRKPRPCSTWSALRRPNSPPDRRRSSRAASASASGSPGALAADPELVLMDEPFSAVDALTKEGLIADVMRLRAEIGFAAIIVTHDLAEAIEFADRIAVMDEAGSYRSGPPKTSSRARRGTRSRPSSRRRGAPRSAFRPPSSRRPADGFRRAMGRLSGTLFRPSHPVFRRARHGAAGLRAAGRGRLAFRAAGRAGVERGERDPDHSGPCAARPDGAAARRPDRLLAGLSRARALFGASDPAQHDCRPPRASIPRCARPRSGSA